MTHRIDRIEGQVMPANSYVVHGPDGLVIVDGMLTVSDAALVRQAIDDTARPLAGVVITHPHPDHYAGLGHLIGADDVPIVATRAVDAVIRRDDATKHDVVGPMMGDEWPTNRLFPNQTAIEAGSTAPVVAAMQALLPSDDLLFLMELSIEPVLAALAARR